MKRKDVGISIAIVGLLAGAFLAGGAIFGGSSSGAGSVGLAPSMTSTIASTTTADVSPVSTPATGGLVPVGGKSTSNGGTGEGSSSGQGPLTPEESPEAPGPADEEPAEESGEEPVEEVNEAPFIVSVSPGDLERGVALSTGISVTFSEAMDAGATQAAFAIQPSVAGEFAWNSDGTVMTFSPHVAFEYNTKVEWSIDASAKDSSGLELVEGIGASFSVLRQKTINLYSVPGLDGFVYAPPVAALEHVVTAPIAGHNSLKVGSWMRGFISFDLAKLPESAVDITSAQLFVHQRDHHVAAYTAETGALWVVSLPYGSLDIADYSTPTPTICPNVCYPLGLELSSAAADGWKSVEVTPLVRGDWNSASVGDMLSQFRLQFLSENAGDGPDAWAEFHSGESANMGPRLEVTFTYE